jgi:hypothetical protein
MSAENDNPKAGPVESLNKGQTKGGDSSRATWVINYTSIFGDFLWRRHVAFLLKNYIKETVAPVWIWPKVVWGRKKISKKTPDGIYILLLPILSLIYNNT